ncbi:MAG: hypothetical protein R6X02_20055 [Enhygromyxa sp.]
MPPLAQAADAELRRTTLESALCHLLPGAWESAVYWAFCPGDSPFRRDALTWVALLGDGAAHSRLLMLLDDPAQQADALWAVGFCGRVASVDRCIELLDDERLGPLAAEVVCATAGLPTNIDHFWRDRPEPDDEEEAANALPELDDDLDADLVPTQEDALPIPDPETIRAWWQARRDQFDPSLRYLGGRPLDRGVLAAAMWHAPMRRRHALALEAAVRTRGSVFINTRALCVTQRSQVEGLMQVERLDCQLGFGLG